MARQRDQDAGFAQGNSRGGASGDGSAGGARGRGARMAGATKTVFQPTVRAPPLGVHSRMRSAPNRAHAELKAGRSGLALVNKKPATAAPGTGGGLTANDASSEQPADSAHEPGADAAAGPANPWVRHAQPPVSAPPTAALAQPHAAPEPRQPADEGARTRPRGRQPSYGTPQGVPSMRWDEMDDNSNYHMGGLDDYDEGFTSDGARARPGPRLLEKRQPVVQAEEAPAIHTNSEAPQVVPATAATEAATPAPEPTVPEPTAPVVVLPHEAAEERPARAPDEDKSTAPVSPAEVWGSRAKAAGSSRTGPAADPPGARWSKASLASGSRLTQTPAPPTAAAAARKPAAARGPARPVDSATAGGDSSNGRSQGARAPRGSGRQQQQAHIPTVVPPVALARASARSVERRPPPSTAAGEPSAMPAPCVLEATVEVAGDLSPVAPAASAAAVAVDPGCTQLADAEPVAASSPRAGPVAGDSGPKVEQPLLDASGGIAKAKPNAGSSRSLRAESWRSAAPAEPAKAPSANGRGSNARTTQRPPPPPPPQQQQQQPSERRGERGRAATNSLAASSGNWRSAPNRSEKSPAAVPEPAPVAARPAGVAAKHRWPETPAELQQPAPYGRGGALGRPGDDRQRAHTQGASARPRGDRYGAPAGLNGLMHLSEAAPASAAFGSQLPLSSVHNSGIHGMPTALSVSHPHRRSTASPPLLPHAMLADILGDGEPASRTKPAPELSAEPGDRAAGAAEAHVRNRRISAIVGAAPRDEIADAGRRLGYGSRVRSASSLFDVPRSSTGLAHAASNGPGRDFGADADLFSWQQQGHKGSARTEPNRLPTQPAAMSSAAKAVDSAAPMSAPAPASWGYAPVHSAQATVLHPLYAAGGSGLAPGMAHGFQAFSPGAGTLWPDPGPRAPLPPRKPHPQSREDSAASSNPEPHHASSAKPPRPIGTRGANRARGSGQTQAAAASAPPYQQPVPPASRYPWQVQYAMQPPHVYGMPQGAMLDSSLSYFSSQAMPGPSAGSPATAPYMVPVPPVYCSHPPMVLYPQVPAMDPTLSDKSAPASHQRPATGGAGGDASYIMPTADGSAPQPQPVYPYPPYPGPMGVPDAPQQYMQYMSPSPHHMAMVPMYMGLVDMQSGATMAEAPAPMYAPDGYPFHAAADGWPGYPPSSSSAADAHVPGAAPAKHAGEAGASSAAADSRRSSRPETAESRADAPARHPPPASRSGRGGRARPPQDTPPPQPSARRQQPRTPKTQRPAPTASQPGAGPAAPPPTDAKRPPRADRRRRPAKSEGAAAAAATAGGSSDDRQQRPAHRSRGGRNRRPPAAPAAAAA